MREPSASGPQNWSGSRDLHPHDQGGGLSCCCYIRATILDSFTFTVEGALVTGGAPLRSRFRFTCEHPPGRLAPPGRRADSRLGWGPRVGA